MQRLKFIYLLIFALFLNRHTSLNAQSQRQWGQNNNGWYMYIGDHKLAPKWGLHLEAQFRRNDIIVNAQQLLLRGGINFYTGPNAFITAGYCFVKTHPYGVFPVAAAFPENRFWQQLQLKALYGRFENVNRFRLEQRYVYSPVLKDSVYKPGPAVYSNRARYFTRVSLPFKGKTIEDKSFYLSVYEELFVAFGSNVRYNIFDQNRAYIALGYKIPKIGRLEIGYLNQLIFRSDGIRVENNHTLQLGLVSAVDFYKAAK